MDADYMIPAIVSGMIRDLSKFLYKSELNDNDKELREFYIEDSKVQFRKYFDELEDAELSIMATSIDDFKNYSLTLLDTLTAFQYRDASSLGFMRHALVDSKRNVEELVISLICGLEAADIAKEELSKYLPVADVSQDDFINQGFMVSRMMDNFIKNIMNNSYTDVEKQMRMQEFKTRLSRYFGSLTDKGVQNVCAYLEDYKIECIALAHYMSDHVNFEKYDPNLKLFCLRDILYDLDESEVPSYLDVANKVVNLAMQVFRNSKPENGTQGQIKRLNNKMPI